MGKYETQCKNITKYSSIIQKTNIYPKKTRWMNANMETESSTICIAETPRIRNLMIVSQYRRLFFSPLPSDQSQLPKMPNLIPPDVSHQFLRIQFPIVLNRNVTSNVSPLLILVHSNSKDTKEKYKYFLKSVVFIINNNQTNVYENKTVKILMGNARRRIYCVNAQKLGQIR